MGTQKTKGIIEIIAGIIIALIGIPLLVLPGPGIIVIIGGIALALRGQRNLTGRPASNIEVTLEENTQKLAQKAKDQAAQKAQKTAQSAAAAVPEVATRTKELAHAVSSTAAQAAEQGKQSYINERKRLRQRLKD